MTIWAPAPVSDMSWLTWVQKANAWHSIQVRYATILCKSHSNYLINVYKKYHCSQATHYRFSFFGCNSEVNFRMFAIVVLLGSWIKIKHFITKKAQLCALYQPWNPRQIFLDFMCPKDHQLPPLVMSRSAKLSAKSGKL